jgi:hypothetical protein
MVGREKIIWNFDNVQKAWMRRMVGEKIFTAPSQGGEEVAEDISEWEGCHSDIR